MPRKCCWLKKLALDKQPQVQQQMQIHAYSQGVRHIACSACRTKTLLRYRIHICMVLVLGHFIFWLICDPCFLRLFLAIVTGLRLKQFSFCIYSNVLLFKVEKTKAFGLFLGCSHSKVPQKSFENDMSKRKYSFKLQVLFFAFGLTVMPKCLKRFNHSWHLTV